MYAVVKINLETGRKELIQKYSSLPCASSHVDDLTYWSMDSSVEYVVESCKTSDVSY